MLSHNLTMVVTLRHHTEYLPAQESCSRAAHIVSRWLWSAMHSELQGGQMCCHMMGSSRLCDMKFTTDYSTTESAGSWLMVILHMVLTSPFSRP